MNNYIHANWVHRRKQSLQFYQADHEDWGGKGPNQIIWEWNPTAEKARYVLRHKPHKKQSTNLLINQSIRQLINHLINWSFSRSMKKTSDFCFYDWKKEIFVHVCS